MKIVLVEAKLCYGDGITEKHVVPNSRFSFIRIRMKRAAEKVQNNGY